MVTDTVYTMDEVKKNNNKDGARTWIVIRGVVYDVTDYLDEHPGGPELVTEYAGRDCTKAFEDAGHSLDANRIMKKYKIGMVQKEEKTIDSDSLGVKNMAKRKRKLLFLYCA